jgi:hypothetical protein
MGPFAFDHAGLESSFHGNTDTEAEKGAGMYLLKRKNVNVFLVFTMFLR